MKKMGVGDLFDIIFGSQYLRIVKKIPFLMEIHQKRDFFYYSIYRYIKPEEGQEK